MTTSVRAIVFFDIGDTLASVRVSPGGDRIEEMLVFADVPPTLASLRADGVRLGILSNRGAIPEENVTAALERAQLLPHFDPGLILFGRKDTPRLFEQAASRARDRVPPGAPAPPLLFVGEDASERLMAATADFLVCPHPRLVQPVLARAAPLRYLRITPPAGVEGGSWRASLRALPLVPLHLTSPGPAPAALYAIADAAVAAQLDDLGFWVDRLGSENEPLLTDLFLLRDDRQADSGFLAPEGNSLGFFGAAGAAGRVLASTPEGLLVSVPAGRSVESYHFSGARHGHNLKLVASPALLESPDPADNPRLAATIEAAPELFAEGFADALAGPPADETATGAPAAGLAVSPALSAPERSRISEMVRPQRIARWVQRYTGLAPVEGGALISRHIHHPDNARAVRTLCHDLAGLGSDSGRLTVRTHGFVHEGRAHDNVEATLGGSGRAGVVLVTAHLDSTGARGTGYRASVDAAPGADDDASGVAGVLCAAETLLALTGESTRPRRELRFVLFNAEEHGLVGSRAYAREQARLGAKIVAVLQMDRVRSRPTCWARSFAGGAEPL